MCGHFENRRIYGDLDALADKKHREKDWKRCIKLVLEKDASLQGISKRSEHVLTL